MLSIWHARSNNVDINLPLAVLRYYRQVRHKEFRALTLSDLPILRCAPPPAPRPPAEHRWYVDGVLYCDRDYWYSRPGPEEDDYPFPAPFDTGFYIIINIAVGGGFTGGPIDEVSGFK